MPQSEPNPQRRLLLQGTLAGAVTAGLTLPGVALAKAAAPPDATAWAQQLRSGEVTPLEALEAAIARVEALPKLNAVVIRDFALARAQAQKLSSLGRAARAQATKSAPLWGVPFLLKDLGQDLQGTVTTNGCAFFKGAVAAHSTTLVQRHQAAGLNIFGKTASPEFGMTTTTESRLYGVTPNPWNAAHTTGGSSGGAAAVVAAAILPLAHGSDGGGSLRIPAAHCGVFGLKPSRGRVPGGPDVLEGSMGLSINHAISRSVRDSALLLDLTAGPEAGSRARPPEGAPGSYVQALLQRPRKLRVALWRKNYFGVPVHPDCLAAMDAAAKACEALGHNLEEKMPELPVQEIYTGMGAAMGAGMLYTIERREKLLGRAVREDEMEPLDWAALQQAKKATAQQLYAARLGFDKAGQLIDAFFDQYDLVLSPTTAVPAQKLGVLTLDQPFQSYAREAMNSSAFTSLFNISGHPAMSVPAHWTADGLPVGAQFAAPYGREDRLLALAAQLEQTMPWTQRMPDLSVFKA